MAVIPLRPFTKQKRAMVSGIIPSRVALRSIKSLTVASCTTGRTYDVQIGRHVTALRRPNYGSR